MKITATKENLLLGVSAVQKAVSTKTTLQILTCIKLEVQKDKLYFSATDLEIGIQCHVPIEVMEEGATVVPAKYFFEIVRKLPDSLITLETVNENELVIKYENSQLNFKTLPADDFPELPDIDSEYELTITAAELKQMIRQIVFACSTDERRPLFTGVLCEVENDNFRMISTDTHRLALKQGKIETKAAKLLSFIIPAKILSELARLVQNDEEICYINISKNLATFLLDNILVVCRLLEGQFPNYRQVVPTQYNLKIKTKTKLLSEAVERISLFSADNNTNTVKMKIEGSLLTIFSQSELGQGYEQIEIKSDGEPVEIALNYRYLLDVFKVIDDEFLTIEFTGSLSPGIIRPLDNDNFLYLILPVRS
ncbi:MAG: DNA polymerase III subunit beta [Clostridia bacterium]|nr:DNA polymerase III subunit beta [Clostridia bacterium]MDD4146298.1 DNA polymerase III subunit beta [Clostridia bacterium]MDD4665319.1 DNA polymerase III subunit beta [Clostridia bacterium]